MGARKPKGPERADDLLKDILERGLRQQLAQDAGNSQVTTLPVPLVTAEATAEPIPAPSTGSVSTRADPSPTPTPAPMTLGVPPAINRNDSIPEPTHGIPVPPPPTRDAIDRLGLAQGSKPLAKTQDPAYTKVGPLILLENKNRAEDVLLKMKRAGSRNDFGDLVDAGLAKVLPQLEAGLMGDDKPDAWDVLDDVAMFLKEALKGGFLPPNWHGRAEELLGDIEKV